MAEDLEGLVRQGRHDEAWQALYDRARSEERYSGLRSLWRVRRRLLAGSEQPDLPARARVALLSAASVDLLEEPLLLALESLGIAAEIHSTAYNSLAHEVLGEQSSTMEFGPDIAVIVSSPYGMPTWPAWNATVEVAKEHVDEAAALLVGPLRAAP